MARGPEIRVEEVEKVRVLLAEGKTQKEIGLAIGRSIPTVGKLIFLAKHTETNKENK